MSKFFEVIIILLIFQDWIACKIPIISYLDEFMCVITIIYVLIYILKGVTIKLSKYEIIAFITLILYLIIGILSNLISGVVPIKLALLSVIITVKGYILYFGWRIIFQLKGIKKILFRRISRILQISVYIFAIIGLLNIPLGFLENRGVRFGINTVAIGFSHVTELAFFAIISMIMVLFGNRVYEINSKDYKIIIPSVFLVILTGRSKAIAFIFIFLIIFYFSKIFKKISLKYAIIGLPVVLMISMPRIKSELLNGARGDLYDGAIRIAKDFFPFGSGFGTYGSYISRFKYSPLYYRYGLSGIWGLSPEMPSYITDTYWAMVLGECGIIGLILIIILLLLIFIQFVIIKADYKLKTLSISLIIYTIMSSIAEPIYSSNKCAAFFIVSALFITYMRSDNK